jgi:hypothetical protein
VGQCETQADADANAELDPNQTLRAAKEAFFERWRRESSWGPTSASVSRAAIADDRRYRR